MMNRRMSTPYQNDNSKKGSIKDLFKAMKPYLKWFIITILLILVSTIIAITAPQLLSKITDEMAKHAATRTIDTKYIIKVGSILVGMYVISGLTNYLSSFIMTTITQNYVKNVRMEIIKKINKMPLKYFDSHKYGDTLSIMTNDVDQVSQSFQQAASMMLSSSLLIIGSLIAMFLTQPIMALTVLATVPLMLLMLLFITKIALPHFRRRQEIIGELNSIVEENLSGQTVIKAFNASERKTGEFEKANNNLKWAMIKAQLIAGFMQPVTNLISYIAYAAVCVVGGLLLNAGKGVTYGTITAFLVYVNLFQNPMSQIAQAFNNLQMAAASAYRIYSFLEEDELSAEDDKNLQFEIVDNKPKIIGKVEFKNVKFGYNKDRTIINNFSAKIDPGMKVAIVGPTGAGKTTIVNLLMRFYEIDEGDILIDDVSIKNMKREEVHNIFGMVLQDTWLFEGTIRDNIVFSKSGISDEKLKEICKEAGIWSYVKHVPGKLDHQIFGDDSVSSGQRQLLTIARAMANNAPLLILDEATSNVDTRTEEVIQEAMDKLMENRTSFVIAHRLSTIKNADMIFVMDNGNIVEQGTHDELMTQNGFYANLYNSQFANN